jgi:ABC-type polysaccharide/polyol phosphate export permease
LSQTELAISDMVEGVTNTSLWVALGWQDIRQRYRRSTLGPLWLTLSMAVTVGGIGTVYSGLFGQKIADYLPFVALGFIFWGFIAGVVTDGCSAFIGTEAFIKQIRIPVWLHVIRLVWRNLIIFGHNFVIFIAVALILQVWPQPVAWLALPAMLLLLINSLWVAMVLGLVCARFRDVPQIVNSILQLGFLVTPIIWKPEILTHRVALIHWNPIHHFIDIVRRPLLGGAPEPLSWYVVLGITVAGWLFTFLLFRRYRWRVPYWV